MCNSIKKLFFSFILLAIIYQAKAQTLEMGFNIGLVGTRYTVSQNSLGNSAFIRQGEINYSSRVGFQASLKAVPEKFKPRFHKIDHGFIFEIAASNGGGNLELVQILPDKSFLVGELNYRTWQGELNLLYKAKIRKVQLLMGPSFTYHTYRAVTNSLVSSNESLFTQGKINSYYVGVDFGLAYRYKKLLVATRYHRNVTAFGEKTQSIPVSYNNHQARLVFSFFLFEKSLRKLYRGLYF